VSAAATTNPLRPATRSETIEPFFFAGPRGSLYGCQHRPANPAAQRAAVLLCAPTGHEYTACHRALRQLASQLCRAGRHVMRFDYGGSGDSAGDYADARLQSWRDDIAIAIDECRRRSGAAEVALVGLRLGATLALQVARQRSPREGDIARLVLWNPVLDGAALLHEWRDAAADFVAELGWQVPAQTEQVLGLPLSAGMADDLNTLDAGIDGLGPLPVLICHDPADSAVPAFAERLRASGRAVDVRAIEGGAVWRKLELEAIVPAQTLTFIGAWL
jgi:alpha/beta superfamily hydrolase